MCKWSPLSWVLKQIGDVLGTKVKKIIVCACMHKCTSLVFWFFGLLVIELAHQILLVLDLNINRSYPCNFVVPSTTNPFCKGHGKAQISPNSKTPNNPQKFETFHSHCKSLIPSHLEILKVMKITISSTKQNK
jgi:hypothetical protein